MPELAVILPAYNVENTIGAVLSQLRRHLPEAVLVVVNDGSTDNTALIVAEIQDPQVFLLSHSQNAGKGAAIKTGIHFARKRFQPRFYGFMDTDGQHDPGDLKRLYLAAKEGRGDFLIGQRQFHPGVMPLPRICSNFITSGLISLKLRRRIRDSQSGMRLVGRNIIDHLPVLNSNGYEFETEFLLKAGRMQVNFFELPISTKYGNEKSHIHPMRDIFRFLRIFFQA